MKKEKMSVAIKSGVYFTTIDQEVKAKLDALDTQLLSLAQQRGFKQPVLRNIFPQEDLGLTNEVFLWNLTTANAYNAVISKLDLAKKKIIGFVGVYYPSSNPIVSAVKLTQGVGDTVIKDYWYIEHVSALDKPFALANTPIIYDYDTVVNIYFYAKATGSDNLVLLGRVAEPAGTMIS
ncbi:MAG: hypothetical protein QXO62_06715 [Thermoproteota archaeon]